MKNENETEAWKGPNYKKDLLENPKFICGNIKSIKNRNPTYGRKLKWDWYQEKVLRSN